jgi:hypothetical protein
LPKTQDIGRCIFVTAFERFQRDLQRKDLTPEERELAIIRYFKEHALQPIGDYRRVRHGIS